MKKPIFLLFLLILTLFTGAYLRFFKEPKTKLITHYYCYSAVVEPYTWIDTADLMLLTQNPKSHLFGANPKEFSPIMGGERYAGVVCKELVQDSMLLPGNLSVQDLNKMISSQIKKKSGSLVFFTRQYNPSKYHSMWSRRGTLESLSDRMRIKFKDTVLEIYPNRQNDFYVFWENGAAMAANVVVDSICSGYRIKKL